MYTIEQLSNVFYLAVKQEHVDALAELVSEALTGVSPAAPITTSELLRRLQCPLGYGQKLSGMLGQVRAQHPRWFTVDATHQFMGKPRYLWHQPRAMTNAERAAAIKQAEAPKDNNDLSDIM